MFVAQYTENVAGNYCFSVNTSKMNAN